jgi:hypothetical protein
VVGNMRIVSAMANKRFKVYNQRAPKGLNYDRVIAVVAGRYTHNNKPFIAFWDETRKRWSYDDETLLAAKKILDFEDYDLDKCTFLENFLNDKCVLCDDKILFFEPSGIEALFSYIKSNPSLPPLEPLSETNEIDGLGLF